MQQSILAVAAAIAVVSSCGGDDGPTAIELPVDSIEIVQGCTAVFEGERCQIVVVAMTDEGQRISNPVLRWSSSNSSVATVDSEGLVRGVAGGDATIRVSNTTETASDQTRVRVVPLNPK